MKKAMTAPLPEALERVYEEVYGPRNDGWSDLHRAALLAVYRAGQEATRWQPIETAPIRPFDQKEWFMLHSPYLLLLVGKRVDIGSYRFTKKGKGRWVAQHGLLHGVTHWQPLPEPPQGDG